MRNLLHLLLLFVLPTGLFAQNNLELIEQHQQLLKESSPKNYKSFNGVDWQMDSMRISTKNGNDYTEVRLLEYFYDSKCRKNSKIEHNFNSLTGIIESTYKEDFIYLSDDLLSSSTVYKLINGNWENYTKTDYIYSADTTTLRDYRWIDSSGIWKPNSYRVKITTNGLVRSFSSYSNTSNHKFEYIYNVGDQLIKQYSSSRADSTMSWDTTAYTEYIYNNSGLRTESINYLRSNSSNIWVGFLQVKYFYNNQEQEIECINYRNQLNFWVKESRTVSLYDVNSNCFKTISYDDLDSERGKTEIFYSNKCVSTNQITQNIQLDYYPNPTVDFINIELPKTLQQSTAQLFGVNGKALKQYNFNNNLEQIDISTLPNGNYFLKIKQAESQAILKILKQ